jgi:multiple sugar transport system permease protein
MRWTAVILGHHRIDGMQLTPALSPVAKRRPRGEYFQSERTIRAAFLAPALIVITLILIVPLAYCVRNSFFAYNLTKVYEGQRFIGFGNYLDALRDRYFAGALIVSAVITVCVVSLELVLGFSLALLLNRPLERWSASMKKFLRTVVILPVVLPPVVMGLMWRFMFQYTGIVNYLLTLARIGPVNWTTMVTGIATIIIATVWQNIPFSFLLVLAGLQSIPPDLLDSSMVDGASGWQRIRYLYVPLLRPVIFVILTIRTVDAFRLFDEAYILTRGGPGRSTETISLFIYTNSFSFFDIGYGSALAMLLFFFLMIISVFYVRMVYVREEGA